MDRELGLGIWTGNKNVRLGTRTGNEDWSGHGEWGLGLGITNQDWGLGTMTEEWGWNYNWGVGNGDRELRLDLGIKNGD